MAQCKYELGSRRQLRNGVYTDGINRTDGNPLAKKAIKVFTTSKENSATSVNQNILISCFFPKKNPNPITRIITPEMPTS